MWDALWNVALPLLLVYGLVGAVVVSLIREWNQERRASRRLRVRELEAWYDRTYGGSGG